MRGSDVVDRTTPEQGTAKEWRPLGNALTRRRAIAYGAAAALLASVPGGVRGADATPSASPVGAYPRTIIHEMGETVIPAQPVRIVAASDFMDLDYLLTLGVEPVLYGFTNAWDSGSMPWQATADLPSFDAASELDLEAIAAAKPDLIVATPMIQDAYPVLSDIAPTVVFGWDTDWRVGIQLMATALGLESVAEQQIAAADEVIGAAREQLAPVAGKSMMVAFEYGETFYIWGSETAGSKLFVELGLNFVGGSEPSLLAASLEQVNLVADAEILLSVASDPEGIAVQEASPLFQNLPAVQNGGYDVLTVIQARALGDGLSPLSLPWVIPQFVELMLRLGDGGGRTLS
ncbi:MAG: ABC transporter substrate-binding protein [Thermomicrobiales bacterium]